MTRLQKVKIENLLKNIKSNKSNTLPKKKQKLQTYQKGTEVTK